MMLSIFSYESWSSLVIEYFIFFIYFFLGLVITKIIMLISNVYFTNFSNKTKTKLDDILSEIFSKPWPIKLLIMAFFINYGLDYLTISEKILKIINSGIYVIYVFCITGFILKFILGLIKYYIENKSKEKRKIDEQLLPFIKGVLKVLFFSAALLLIVSNFGYDITTIVAGLGIGGLAIAFAAKDLLENTISGIVIFLEKPFKLGEVIKYADGVGVIERVGIRSTRIRTFDGTVLFVPNSKLSTQSLENFSFRKTRKENIILTLTYDMSVKKLEQAKKIVEELFKENNETIDDTFYVYFDKFDNFSQNISVIYYIKRLDYAGYLEVKDKINMEIKKRFEKAKIDFAYPTQTLILKK